MSNRFTPSLLLLVNDNYLLLARNEEDIYVFFGPDGTHVGVGNVFVAKSITHPGWTFESDLGKVIIDNMNDVQTLDGKPVDDVWNSFEEFDIVFTDDNSQVTITRK